MTEDITQHPAIRTLISYVLVFDSVTTLCEVSDVVPTQRNDSDDNGLVVGKSREAITENVPVGSEEISIYPWATATIKPTLLVKQDTCNTAVQTKDTVEVSNKDLILNGFVSVIPPGGTSHSTENTRGRESSLGVFADVEISEGHHTHTAMLTSVFVEKHLNLGETDDNNGVLSDCSVIKERLMAHGICLTTLTIDDEVVVTIAQNGKSVGTGDGDFVRNLDDVFTIDTVQPVARSDLTGYRRN